MKRRLSWLAKEPKIESVAERMDRNIVNIEDFEAFTQTQSAQEREDY